MIAGDGENVLKLLYVVLDGAPDGLRAPRTALSEAYKPHIDSLARNSVCGLAYIIGRGIAPESDAATISLLGYEPEKYYTGRGPLEAIGAGMEFAGNRQVAIRANFATLDPETFRIIDRRVGRSLSNYEARQLAEAIDGVELDNGRATAYFKHTIGHRGVLVIEHKTSQLSGWISNTDPAYSRVGLISHALEKYEKKLALSKPLKNDPAARLTARLVNEYTMKTIDILVEHPVNKERITKGFLPANGILLRDAGHEKPSLPPIREATGLEWYSVTEMPVEKGIAIIAGMRPLETPLLKLKNRGSILEFEAKLASQALSVAGNVGVYVHLKGPDEPGHDGDLSGKISAIEEIDRYFFQPLMDIIEKEDVAVIVTSDHSTPWHLRSHSDDPVPVMVYHSKIMGKARRFDEHSCRDGELGLIEKGSYILPKALSVLKQHSVQ